MADNDVPVPMDIDSPAEADEQADPVVIEEEKLWPLFDLADWRFQLALPDDLIPVARKTELKDKVLAFVQEHSMAPLHAQLTSAGVLPQNPALHKLLSDSHDKLLADLDAKITDAQENQGALEVHEARFLRANRIVESGAREEGLAALDAAFETADGASAKLDVCFALLRTALFHNDVPKIKELVLRAHVQMEKGGDWERRNRLKVYEGVQLVLVRDFEAAAKLLIDTVATFTASELIEYKHFVFFTVLLCTMTLSRVELKEKVIKAPEILQAIGETPFLEVFLNSFYKCQYREFFSALLEILNIVKVDRLLSRHADYMFRELRIRAYGQFLEAYESVTLPSMAVAFGISESLLDRDLSRFIASGRLACKINKVKGIIEHKRPDTKNAQYQAVLEQGDALLHKVQKLARVAII